MTVLYNKLISIRGGCWFHNNSLDKLKVINSVASRAYNQKTVLTILNSIFFPVLIGISSGFIHGAEAWSVTPSTTAPPSCNVATDSEN